MLQTLIIKIMKKVTEWLENPKRTMESGVILFSQVAPVQFKEKYLKFFQDNLKASPHTTPYGILVNKLNFIHRNNLYAAQTSEPQAPPVKREFITREQVSNNLDQVPTHLAPVAKRIKEIVPVIAALTAKIADPNLSLDEAKAASEEIVQLEQERRDSWAKIDGKEIEEVDTITLAEKKKTIKLLKEKIKRNEVAAENAKTDGKKKSALKRVKQYTKELSIAEAVEVAE